MSIPRTYSFYITNAHLDDKQSLAASLSAYAMLGAAAALLLALIEWVDLNIQLTPVFESFLERLQLSAYFSMNILIGALLGIIIGLYAYLARMVSRGVGNALSRRGRPGPLIRLIAWFAVAALGAILLNLQPHIHGYVRGAVREMEKFPVLRATLLNHERAATLVAITCLLLGCSIVWALTRASRSWPRQLRAVWMAGLAALIAIAYYVDSRVEVLLYEHSLHHSMFLLNMTLSLALAATFYLSSPVLQAFSRDRRSPLRRLFLPAALLLVALVVFTFVYFDDNQNLKHQVFHRSTQTKQYVKLAQWALDFDRDGYAAALGGGDADDGRADVHPGSKEIPDDGIDNNCVGGDLTGQAIGEWKSERASLRPPVARAARRLNVIYIFIDALRADHLGVYGYRRATSPNIDKLAARSAVFENAYTPAPNTFEAFPKFMQSSHWDAHLETWSEALARNGYNNLLFPRRLSTQKRYIKGMQIVHHVGKRLTGTIETAIDVLGKAPQDRPFCAFLYATDPHRPYLKHDQFDFGSSLIDYYDGEIAHTDAQFGRLFDWMESTGRMRDTMVVIMADHGESLGERGVYKHSSQLYNEQSRVPMIIYVPDVAPRRVPDFVSTIDLGPTILSTVGIEYSKEHMGVSLLPLIKGEPFTHPPVFAEQTYGEDSPFVDPSMSLHPDSKRYMVITQDGFKLIYNRNAYTFELFDLKADPQELRNLYDYNRPKAEEMKILLGRFIDIVVASRPWDADESQYVFGNAADEDDEM